MFLRLALVLAALAAAAWAEPPEVSGDWGVLKGEGANRRLERKLAITQQGRELAGTLKVGDQEARFTGTVDDAGAIDGTWLMPKEWFRPVPPPEVMRKLLERRGSDDRQHFALKVELQRTEEGLRGSFVGIWADWRGDEITRIEDRREAAVVYRPRCPRIKGPITFGQGEFQVVLELDRELEPLEAGDDSYAREGLCHYREFAVAKAGIRTAGLAGGSFSVNVPVPTCDVDVYLREYGDPTAAGDFDEVRLDWADGGTGQVKIPGLERWGLSFRLYSFGATLRPDGNALRFDEAQVSVQIDVDGGEHHLGGPVYLSGNLSSVLTYGWNANATSWTDGKWYFDAMADVVLEVRRGGFQPLARLALSFDDDGQIQTTLDLAELAEWEVGGLKVSLDDCSLLAHISLRDGTFRLVEGSLSGTVTLPRPVDAALRVGFKWETNRFRASVGLEGEVDAFGGKLSEFSLEADIDTEQMEFRRISGSVAYTHPQLSKITISRFVVEDGKLKEFHGSGEVTYKSFTLTVSGIRYDGTTDPGRLEISAALNLGWSKTGTGSIEIRDFTVDTNGVISSFSISAAITAAPVDVTFSASFTGNEFSGRFDGSFGGNIRLAGTVLIGMKQPEGYKYGYLAIELRIGRGIPIGNSGLVLLGFNGAFGCNCFPDGNGGFTKQLGTYHIEAGLTIGDVGGLAALNGTVSLTLGTTNAITIKGRLEVTQSQPYFTGELSCRYVFGSESISGDVTCSVTIPQSGSVVRIDRNRLTYGVFKEGGVAKWRLQGQRLGGTLLSFLEIRGGNIDLRGNVANPVSSLRGSLGGRLKGSARASYSYDGWIFDFDGGFSVDVGGSMNVTVDDDSFSGDLGLTIDLNGYVTVDYPGSGWFSSGPARATVSGHGRVTGTYRNGRLRVSGTVTFSSGSYSMTVEDFSYTF